MLNLGRQIAQVCGRTTRRELLRAGGLAAAGLSLADLLRLEARGQGEPRKANSVILLWLWGGPSHLDTFDMKPKAPVDYRGPYAPVPTRVPGIQICELFPLLAVPRRGFLSTCMPISRMPVRIIDAQHIYGIRAYL